MTIKNFINIINESETEVKSVVVETNDTNIQPNAKKKLVEYIAEVQSEEPAKPLSQKELSHLFDEEFPNVQWHHVIDEQKIYNQFKPISDKIFGHISAVPFAHLYVLSTIEDSDVAVHKVISWIRQHGAMVNDRIRYNFNSVEATGEVFRIKDYPLQVNGEDRVANVSFLIYFDKHGEYVFAWSRDAMNESFEPVEEGKTWKDEKDGAGKKWDWKTKQQERKTNKDKRMSGEDLEEGELDETKALAEEMQAILNRAGMDYTVEQVLALNETDFVELALTTKDTIELKEAAVIDTPVANAIRFRIINQRIDLLAEYGLDAVIDAINDVAEFAGDPEEIGSSDVSGWVRSVEDYLKSSAPKGDTASMNDLFPNHEEKMFSHEELPEEMTIMDGDEELDESIALVDDGYMKHIHDIDGLKAYLIQAGIIPANSALLSEHQFNKYESMDDEDKQYYYDVPVYEYHINLNERGYFYADVRDSSGNTVFEIKNEEEGDDENEDDFFDQENEFEDGELDEAVAEPDSFENDELTDHFEAISNRVSFGYLSGFYDVDGDHFHYDIVCPEFEEDMRDSIAASLEAGNIEGRVGLSGVHWKLKVSQGNPIAEEYPSTTS